MGTLEWYAYLGIGLGAAFLIAVIAIVSCWQRSKSMQDENEPLLTEVKSGKKSPSGKATSPATAPQPAAEGLLDNDAVVRIQRWLEEHYQAYMKGLEAMPEHDPEAPDEASSSHRGGLLVPDTADSENFPGTPRSGASQVSGRVSSVGSVGPTSLGSRGD